jgi:hypothetical protein
MSDEQENQKAEPEKASDGSDKPAAEPAKAGEAADKPAAEADKTSAEADKPADQAASAKPSAAAAKAAGPKPPRTRNEKILLGLVVLAILGFLVAVVNTFNVLNQAKNPYSQSQSQFARPPASEAELEKDEAQFAPKVPAEVPKDSAAFKEQAAKPGAKPAGPAPTAKKHK